MDKDLHEKIMQLSMDQYDQGQNDAIKSIVGTIDVFINLIGDQTLTLEEFRDVLKKQIKS